MATAPPAGHILLTLRVNKDEETGQYVSRCEELDVASCGDTVDEAFEALDDAIHLYLDALEEEGERKRVLEKRGITIQPGESSEAARQVTAHPWEIVSIRTMSVPTLAA